MKTTVVIPAFNCADVLRNCLESAGIQAVRGATRVIVVDNGSSDGTAEVADASDIEVIATSRPGPAAARNAGLAASDTPYVAFLDADCVPEAGWLDALTGALEGSEHAGVGGRIRWTSGQPHIGEYFNAAYPTNETTAFPGTADDAPPYLLTANAAFRRDELDEVGGFDARLAWCEDLELGVRLSAAGRTFGYAADATVGIVTPESTIDVFSQFYKYGYGLEHVQETHPGRLPWVPGAGWTDVLAAAGSFVKDAERRPQHALRFVTELGYLAGWVDARARRMAHRWMLPPSAPMLEVITDVASLTEPLVALTIDDGPTPESTPGILKALREHAAHATFFLVGARSESHPELVRDIVADGHAVFGHGFTHRRLDGLATGEIVSELERTEAVLRRFRPTPADYLVRLPFGAGAHDPHVHAAVRRWRPGCRIAQWSLSLDDWQLAGMCDSHEALDALCESRVNARVFRGDVAGAVVLLHDAPIGARGALVAESSLMLLEHLLNALVRLRVRTIPLGGRS